MIPLTDFEKAISGKTVLIDSNIIIYLTDSVLPQTSPLPLRTSTLFHYPFDVLNQRYLFMY